MVGPDEELLPFQQVPEMLDGCHTGQQLPVKSAVAGLRLCELHTEESYRCPCATCPLLEEPTHLMITGITARLISAVGLGWMSSVVLPELKLP